MKIKSNGTTRGKVIFNIKDTWMAYYTLNSIKPVMYLPAL